MNQAKLDFLRKDFPALLRKLKGNEQPVWGVMNPQQMIEHMTEYIQIGYEKIKLPIHTPEEQLPGFRNFMMSEKEFRPNTKNAIMSTVPPPVKQKSISEAVDELEKEVQNLIHFFKKNPDYKAANPFFGYLNYTECVQLLHKHAVHHAKQFSLI